MNIGRMRVSGRRPQDGTEGQETVRCRGRAENGEHAWNREKREN